MLIYNSFARQRQWNEYTRFVQKVITAQAEDQRTIGYLYNRMGQYLITLIMEIEALKNSISESALTIPVNPSSKVKRLLQLQEAVKMLSYEIHRFATRDRIGKSSIN